MTLLHFALQELSSGAYATIGTREGFWVSNAAIIDLGGETLLAASNLIPVGLEIEE